MSDRDPTFLWETEALRDSPRRRHVSDRPATPSESGPAWVTLREAHNATGIPIDTLRKWARKGAVPSFLDESGDHVLRMIGMEAVRNRAADLGRDIAPIRPPQATSAPPAPRRDGGAAPKPEPEHRPEPPARPEPDRREESVPAPEGTMIVPIAAWDKMLMQLGNLHEAGQQLAEARERAAKAETEAAFLRERLGEMRREVADRRTADVPETPSPPAAPETAAEPEPSPAEPGKEPEKLWRYIYRGWKKRRR